jgi:hypothetical protein
MDSDVFYYDPNAISVSLDTCHKTSKTSKTSKTLKSKKQKVPKLANPPKLPILKTIIKHKSHKKNPKNPKNPKNYFMPPKAKKQRISGGTTGQEFFSAIAQQLKQENLDPKLLGQLSDTQNIFSNPDYIPIYFRLIPIFAENRRILYETVYTSQYYTSITHYLIELLCQHGTVYVNDSNTIALNLGNQPLNKGLRLIYEYKTLIVLKQSNSIKSKLNLDSSLGLGVYETYIQSSVLDYYLKCRYTVLYVNADLTTIENLLKSILVGELCFLASYIKRDNFTNCISIVIDGLIIIEIYCYQGLTIESENRPNILYTTTPGLNCFHLQLDDLLLLNYRIAVSNSTVVNPERLVLIDFLEFILGINDELNDASIYTLKRGIPLVPLQKPYILRAYLTERFNAILANSSLLWVGFFARSFIIVLYFLYKDINTLCSTTSLKSSMIICIFLSGSKSFGT